MTIRNFVRLSSISLLIIMVAVLTSCGNKTGKKEINTTKSKMKISNKTFGKAGDKEIKLFELENENGMKISIINYGAIITSVIVPDRDGKFEDVVLGFDSLQGYLDGHPYFGSLVGRYGNRIAKGKFELDGEVYQLAINNGENHLHGGLKGFDKRIWTAEAFEDKNSVGVKMQYTSMDMEEGYPGTLKVLVTYFLTNENELKIDYKAVTDKACPVNLTQHSYFNFTAGKENILNHQLKIKASKYVEVDQELIPTGKLPEVKATALDFLDFHSVAERISQVPGGYDHSYVFDKEYGKYESVVEVYEPESGRFMEMFTTEPAVQLYTGNFLDGSLTGKNGINYNKHYGFCLEAQHYPDSPNQPAFPSTILRPGEEYTQTTLYKFSTK